MNGKRILKSLFTLIFVFLFIGVGLAFRQDIYDWWRLRNYQPPATIKAIVEKTAMTNDAKKYFYVEHPVVANKKIFNEKCRSGNLAEFSIVLGCYIQADGIYIYNVNDPRLNGIEEVTGAHEMLHAAYDRLSSSEREKVDKLTNDAYRKLNDKRLNKTIEQYRKNDPSSVPSELHSILATEEPTLPYALENYYKKYFKDRSKVVNLSLQYEAEFSSRQNNISSIESQLNSLKNDYDQLNSRLEQERAQINSQKELMDRYLANGETEKYNANVESFNSRVSEYNSSVQSLRTIIDEYNNLVQQYQQTAFELNDLYESINSQPSTL